MITPIPLTHQDVNRRRARLQTCGCDNKMSHSEIVILHNEANFRVYAHVFVWLGCSFRETDLPYF